MFAHSGRRFGRWTVIAQAPARTANGAYQWICRCDCGTERVCYASSVSSGHSKSCGCLKREVTAARSTRHGHATRGISPTYHTWSGMIARCTDPGHASYARYGGAGISVDPQWTDFSKFLADMGEKPSGQTLDRINGERGYSKENCRWSTPTQQARNKSNNRLITARGETRTQAEWCEILGLSPATLNDRLANGWSVERALFTQAGTSNNNAKSRMLTHAGRTMCVTDWARATGISAALIYTRLHKGYTDVEAIVGRRRLKQSAALPNSGRNRP